MNQYASIPTTGKTPKLWKRLLRILLPTHIGSWTSHIRANLIGPSLQHPCVILEVLPRKVTDIVCPGLMIKTRLRRTINNMGIYETLNDAIVELEVIRARLSPYVKPQDFLLLFGETAQALHNGLAYLVPKYHLATPSDENRCLQTAATKQNQPEYVAIIICKIKDATPLQNISRQKQQGNTEQHRSYCITWCEFEDIKNRLCPSSRRIHNPSLS